MLSQPTRHTGCPIILQLRDSLSTGCTTKYDRRKTIWKSSLILEFICNIQSSTYILNMDDSLNNNHVILIVMGFPMIWSAFSFLSMLPEILRILFRFQIRSIKSKWSKSERNSSRHSGDLERKKRLTTFRKIAFQHLFSSEFSFDKLQSLNHNRLSNQWPNL